MSRIGKMPVQIPDGIKVEYKPGSITVEGPKGKLSQDVLPEVSIDVKDGVAEVTRKNESKRAKALHGLYRKLLSNMVTGVTTGFTKNLVINGVGYRAEVQDKILVLNLGYSNPIEFQIPDDLNISCEGNNKIIVTGIDRQRVGQVSADIRSLRPPEPYKGKGIKYEDEMIRRKIGKAGVK
ncbi:MAG: 50S ribosomal protein L6 [Spirochaetia bacterium]